MSEENGDHLFPLIAAKRLVPGTADFNHHY